MSSTRLSITASSPAANGTLARRTVWFAAALAALGLFFWVPLRALAAASFEHEYCSHIPLIPVIALALLWFERDRLPARRDSSLALVAGLLATAAVLTWTATHFSHRLGENDYLSVSILAFVLSVWGIFVLCYGKSSFRASLFPLLFLILMVPIPDVLRSALVTGLQRGSAEVCSWLFRISGTPVFHEGLTFTLPGVKIEVAEACSGIRSTIAMSITVLLAGHLFLRSVRKEVVLMAALLPVVIFKNALRIVIITLLGVHVSRSFLRGTLHHDGGFLFFLLGMAMLAPLFFWLRRRPRAKAVPDPREREGGRLASRLG